MPEPETLDPSIHRVATLLPWYVNGTLGAAERQEVVQHLAGCAACREELDLLSALRGQIKEVYAAESGPSERTFQSVMAQITTAREQQPATVMIGNRVGLLNQIEGWFRSLFLPRWVPVLASALIVGQLGLLLWTGYLSRSVSDIATRSIPPVSSVSVKVRIAFQATAQEQQIRSVVQELHGRLVGGPTDEGIYFIEVTAGDPAGLETQLAAVRKQPDVVKQVELVRP